MNKFLKLSNLIINTSKIIYIDILPSKYMLRLSCQKINGDYFLGQGRIDTMHKDIIVCSNDDPQDYEIVKKWIEQI